MIDVANSELRVLAKVFAWTHKNETRCDQYVVSLKGEVVKVEVKVFTSKYQHVLRAFSINPPGGTYYWFYKGRGSWWCNVYHNGGVIGHVVDQRSFEQFYQCAAAIVGQSLPVPTLKT